MRWDFACMSHALDESRGVRACFMPAGKNPTPIFQCIFPNSEIESMTSAARFRKKWMTARLIFSKATWQQPRQLLCATIPSQKVLPNQLFGSFGFFQDPGKCKVNNSGDVKK
jgi:hypothetical protein